MKREHINFLLYWLSVGMFIVFYFTYFLLFCRYHLAYQEQIQLFRLDANYFHEFLTKPGGLLEYLGAFLIQFYLFPSAAASIVTLAGAGVLLISRSILRKFDIHGLVWALTPAILIAALQSHHSYQIGSTLAFILNLSFFSMYVSLHKNGLRYFFGASGWLLIYFLSGGYAFLGLLLIVVYELIYIKTVPAYLMALIYLLLGALVPVLATRYVWFINSDDAWTGLVPIQIHVAARYSLYILIAYFPLLIAGKALWSKTRMSKKSFFRSGWSWQSIVAGAILLLSLTWWLQKKMYDAKTEILLGMDYQIERREWNKALELSIVYPGSNRLITYYTNIALYNKGLLGEKMFDYNQMGSKGLYLEWKINNLAPFFGGELYYQLSYTNEAFRWAFEAMESNGLNPRSLKRLVLTSLINGEPLIAQKYLGILNETIFYKSWARKYQAYLLDDKLIAMDKELSSRQAFAMKTDFWADDKKINALFSTLLNNHPDNRMAYEYYMASLLLERNYNAFVANLSHLKELGYPKIPRHYEEALLVYMVVNKKDAVPEGYSMSEDTRMRFSGYLKALSNYRYEPQMAAKALYKQYGNTYWYYANFYKSND